MTTIIDLTVKKEQESKNPIKLVLFLGRADKFEDTDLSPSDWKFLELIAKDYTAEYDLIFCYDDPNERGAGSLFLGHFNDGVV